MSFKKHICIIVDCLSGGGAEKVAASLSFLLEDDDYEVSIISVRDDITYNFAGKLYNLGTNEPSIKLLKQVKKLKIFRKYYKQINADYYVDFRMRNRFFMELLLHLFVFKSREMIMSVQHYNIFYHIPKGLMFKKIYSKTKAIVGVSNDVVKELEAYHTFKNLKYIPNFTYKKLMQASDLPPKGFSDTAILAIGRLNNSVKQFDKLILSYKNTEAFKTGISLVILGDGPDKAKLQTLINDNDLHPKVKLQGFVDNPYDYIKHCKFLVLSSKFEGMPLVILESLALGTPVVSFNCKSGPSEIITHGKDGLIVENQNFKALEKAIDLLIEDDALYQQLLKNAKNLNTKFSSKELLKDWESVFNS